MQRPQRRVVGATYDDFSVRDSADRCSALRGNGQAAGRRHSCPEFGVEPCGADLCIPVREARRTAEVADADGVGGGSLGPDAEAWALYAAQKAGVVAGSFERRMHDGREYPLSPLEARRHSGGLDGLTTTEYHGSQPFTKRELLTTVE